MFLEDIIDDLVSSSVGHKWLCDVPVVINCDGATDTIVPEDVVLFTHPLDELVSIVWSKLNGCDTNAIFKNHVTKKRALDLTKQVCIFIIY